MKKQDIKIIKTDSIYKLDQFFTKADIAVQCVKEVNSLYALDKFDLIIEPSAGTGSFLKALPLIES